MSDGSRFAPAGAIWVCSACGKSHKDKYGIEGEGSMGWDESCMINSVLCHERKRFDPSDMLIKYWAYEAAQ